MKSTQLLSVVFSLIMITGVSAGSAAFAQSDDLKDQLKDFCEMSDDEKAAFFAEHPRLAQFEDRLANYCGMSEDERKNAIEDFIKEHEDEFRMHHDRDIRERLDMYCKMTDKEKKDFVSEHNKAEEHMAKMNEYCELDEDQRDAYIDEYVDKYSNRDPRNLRDHLAMYCDMTEEKRVEKMQMHPDLPEDLKADFAKYCDMTDDEQDEFRASLADRIDEFKDHMKDVMSDFKNEHKMLVDEMKDMHKEIRDYKAEYERFCKMPPEDREAAIDDPERLAKVSKWCEMTPEQRDDFKREHHDAAKDFKEHHDALDRMKENHDLSPRLREMIMGNHDISDDRYDEIKMKFKEKHGEDSDKRKMELKMKFRDHKSEMKFRFSDMTDKKKSDIRERYGEMKAFKSELRQKSNLTDEQKQELRAQFIEKAKDMQLAWISPRDQVSAGIDPDMIECREGYNLVMKESNGLPMCVKANTAIKMIEKGFAVPAN